MKKFIKDNFTVIVLVISLLSFFKGCSDSREITKMYEENVRGTLTDVIASFANRTVKGEIVIVVAGKESK